MGEFAYRLDYDEAERIRREFSWLGYIFSQLLQYLMIVGLIQLAWRLLTSPLWLFGLRRKKGFIKEIVIDKAVGSTWYYWTYVRFVVGKKERYVHLTPCQAVRFIIINKVKEGDAGVLWSSGKRLYRWHCIRKAIDTAPQLFVSYPHERQQEAEFITNVLKSQGVRVWRDSEKIQDGDSLPHVVEEALKVSQVFVPLLCSQYAASSWCIQEFAKATQLHLPVHPIKIDAGDFFQPRYIQKLLESAGEPLFIDLDSPRGVDSLRTFAKNLAEQLRG